MCSVFKPGKQLDTTPLFSDSHDLPILKLRQNKTYGRFLGHPALGQFIAESSPTARKKLLKNNPNDFRRRVGIVGRYDTHIGHFGESAVAMWEVSRHFPREGPFGEDEEAEWGDAKVGGPRALGEKWSEKERSRRRQRWRRREKEGAELSLFFPSEKTIKSKWTAGIAQMLFGPASEVLAGHREGRPVCFDQVAFVLNARHLNSSAQGFKEEAWGLAEVAAKVFQRREENGVTGDGNGDFEVEEEMEMGEEEQEKQRRGEAESASKTKESREEESEKRFREEVIQRERTHALARVVIRQGDEVLNAALRGHDFERKMEVTVVEREEQRTVSNMGEVSWHVKDLFPRQLTNQYHLADSPLLEQMALFQVGAVSGVLLVQVRQKGLLYQVLFQLLGSLFQVGKVGLRVVGWHVKDLFPCHLTNQYHLADSPLLEQMALFQLLCSTLSDGVSGAASGWRDSASGEFNSQLLIPPRRKKLKKLPFHLMPLPIPSYPRHYPLPPSLSPSPPFPHSTHAALITMHGACLPQQCHLWAASNAPLAHLSSLETTRRCSSACTAPPSATSSLTYLNPSLPQLLPLSLTPFPFPHTAHGAIHQHAWRLPQQPHLPPTWQHHFRAIPPQIPLPPTPTRTSLDLPHRDAHKRSQHTALFISMHGASLSNLIFLPPGSTLLELFPLKFHSHAYKHLALRHGINYFMWESEHACKNLALYLAHRDPHNKSLAISRARLTLFISMHGASLSNLIFLPPGSTVLELFPFKFHSDAYKNLALRHGINYFMWENTHPEASSYTDDCLAKGGWENLEEKECRNVRACFLCARDRSVTAVNMEELDKVLLKVQRAVRRFLHEESLKKLHGSTGAVAAA
ncbi:unnamed protein product [Closterium sp. NIES-54]